MKKKYLYVLAGAVLGAFLMYVYIVKYDNKAKTNALIRDYYLTENAVRVSPHSLRIKMDNGVKDFILVDLRSAQEYNREHIKGAVNIPAYENPYKSAYDDIERIVSAFKKLDSKKEIIVYCYSTPCMTGRKIGKMLAEHGVYVKHLGIGWSEWKNDWKTWNHEIELDTLDINRYIDRGKETDKPKDNIIVPCSAGQFGC